jgi:hypothetical protein
LLSVRISFHELLKVLRDTLRSVAFLEKKFALWANLHAAMDFTLNKRFQPLFLGREDFFRKQLKIKIRLRLNSSKEACVFLRRSVRDFGTPCAQGYVGR